MPPVKGDHVTQDIYNIEIFNTLFFVIKVFVSSGFLNTVVFDAVPHMLAIMLCC